MFLTGAKMDCYSEGRGEIKRGKLQTDGQTDRQKTGYVHAHVATHPSMVPDLLVEAPRCEDPHEKP